MPKRQVFYSFHYDNDVMRVQQIRNIGALDGNKLVSENEWETVKRGGEASIKRWIDDNLHYKSCLVVLIGSETASRKWVKYEIETAWNKGMAVLGIHIDDLVDPRYASKPPLYGRSYKGENPFNNVWLSNGQSLSRYVSCYTPPSMNTYSFIANNIEKWIEDAINTR